MKCIISTHSLLTSLHVNYGMYGKKHAKKHAEKNVPGKQIFVAQAIRFFLSSFKMHKTMENLDASQAYHTNKQTCKANVISYFDEFNGWYFGYRTYFFNIFFNFNENQFISFSGINAKSI